MSRLADSFRGEFVHLSDLVCVVPLRDEGRAYAERLIDAGVKTTYVNYPGTIHGFFSMTRFLSQGLKANDEAAAVMGAFFGT
jgi:acetyl esterase